MPSKNKRLPTNAAGPFFVDATCIDCGTCRHLAPTVFDREGEQSRVFHQPEGGEELLAAQRAAIACPTASIGDSERRDQSDAHHSFPEEIAPAVYYLGYHSEKSFAATSYLIVRPGGNVMVDTPRYVKSLHQKIESLGGIRYHFLTHRDDVAEHEKWRRKLGGDRIIHKRDTSEKLPPMEITLEGDDPLALTDDILLIPVPGHTEGSLCLLYKELFLFTGDHLYQNPSRDFPTAFVNHCWYDWGTQTASMRRLAKHSFEWILPGHGGRVHYPRALMPGKIRACVDWMENVR